jgi:hypothetical protein
MKSIRRDGEVLLEPFLNFALAVGNCYPLVALIMLDDSSGVDALNINLVFLSFPTFPFNDLAMNAKLLAL